MTPSTAKRARSLPRSLLTSAVVVALIGGLIYAFRPQPVVVEVGEVALRPFSITVEEQGRTRARNPYIITAPITGRLARTDLDEGDLVQAGQVMAHIAPPPQDARTLAMAEAGVTAADARVAAATAAVDEARASVSRVARERERREELFKNSLASAEEVESFRQLLATEQARLAAAEAGLRAAEAERAAARAQLLGSQTDGSAVQDITAPVAGTIHRVLEENERVVAAGTPLFILSNQDDLEVVVDLLTQDAVQVAPGDPVRIEGWGGDHALAAVVRAIEPEAFTKVSALGVEEQRVNVLIDLVDRPPTLGAEYRVEVAIVTWASDAELTLPTSAIFQQADGWHTYVVTEGRAELRGIRIGHRGRDFTQVADGISAGDRVVVFPSDLIEAGTAVRF